MFVLTFALSLSCLHGNTTQVDIEVTLTYFTLRIERCVLVCMCVCVYVCVCVCVCVVYVYTCARAGTSSLSRLCGFRSEGLGFRVQSIKRH